MTEQLDLFPTDVNLRRIDPSQNMRRFYSLQIAPSLFGEWCLVRQWGRMGTRGREISQWFGNAAAHAALHKIDRHKRRRGYRSRGPYGALEAGKFLMFAASVVASKIDLALRAHLRLLLKG